MKSNLQLLAFALVLAVVCSVLLFGADLFTAPYREANRRAEEVRNFLAALQVPFDAHADARTLVGIFEREVARKQIAGLTVYEYRPGGGDLQAAAVPFSGPGLWGPIRGVLALEADLQTIRGIRFYEQEETPGLGGEIGSEWFQKQFQGKKIVTPAGQPGFSVVRKAGPVDQNAVDAITGATMTSERVGNMINEMARKLEEVRIRYGR